MKLLFLSQRVPYPPDRGDKISTWRLVEHMRRRHEVTVVAFAHDDADREAAAELRAMGVETVDVPHHGRRRRLLSLPLLLTSRPLTLGVYGSRRLQGEVDSRVGSVDAAYAYSSSMGAFLMPHGTPWVMHFAELDSDKWRQYAQGASFPMGAVYRREARTLLAYERGLAAAAVTSVFCTPLEERVFEEQIPGRPSVVLRNGVDLERFRPDPGAAEPGHLVFTGVMDYFPNVDGCLHFVREVLPRVRESVPEARLTIVGAHPTAAVRRLGEVVGVTVTGAVDDTRDWLRRASVAVAPLRIARGIQNKVLEALASGLPVVGTPNATQGVEGEPGRDYLVAEGPEEQAAAIAGLLREPERARELGTAGRRLVEERYDWEQTLAPLEGILAQCARRF